MNRTNEALQIYDQLIKEESTDLVNLRRRADLYARVGKTQEALNDYLRCAKDAPEASLYESIASLYRDLGDIASATMNEEKATSLKEGTTETKRQRVCGDE